MVQAGIFMTEEGSLAIQNPVLTHSGIYKCNAKNALGTDFKSTYLQVVWVNQSCGLWKTEEQQKYWRLIENTIFYERFLS